MFHDGKHDSKNTYILESAQLCNFSSGCQKNMRNSAIHVVRTAEITSKLNSDVTVSFPDFIPRIEIRATVRLLLSLMLILALAVPSTV
jgi:hypothetical protein